MVSRVYISLMSGSSWGGSEDCWYQNLINHQTLNEGVGYTVLSTTLNERVRNELQQRGVRYEIAPWSREYPKGILSRIRNRLFGETNNHATLRKLTEKLIGENQRVLVNQGGSFCISNHSYLLDSLVSGNHSFELVCHSPIVTVPSEEQILRMNRALRHCSRVHVLSDAAASDLRAFFTFDAGKIAFFRNPIQIEKLIAPTLTKGKIKLGFVGRLSASKGLDFSLRLMLDKDVSSYVSSIHFFGEGSIPKSMKDRIKANKIDIFEHGLIQDKSEIYSTFDILLLPSRLEALPNVLVEAGLHGKFPLIPRIGSIACVMPSPWDHYLNPLDFHAYKEQAMNAFSLSATELHVSTLAFQHSVLRYQKEHQLLSF